MRLRTQLAVAAAGLAVAAGPAFAEQNTAPAVSGQEASPFSNKFNARLGTLAVTDSAKQIPILLIPPAIFYALDSVNSGDVIGMDKCADALKKGNPADCGAVTAFMACNAIDSYRTDLPNGDKIRVTLTAKNYAASREKGTSALGKEISLAQKFTSYMQKEIQQCEDFNEDADVFAKTRTTPASVLSPSESTYVVSVAKKLIVRSPKTGKRLTASQILASHEKGTLPAKAEGAIDAAEIIASGFEFTID